MAVHVNVDNFAQAETARFFMSMGLMSGKMNTFYHYREPSPVGNQTVIRMNRDTLYSPSVVDLAGGATVTLPEAYGRYMTAMVIDEYEYIPAVFDKPGTYELTEDMCGSRYVFLALRTFVDANDPEDVAKVNALQDASSIKAASSVPFQPADYDKESQDETREALEKLGGGLGDTKRMFGTKGEVDDVRHLIGSAFGWGGLPESQAFYVVESAPHDVGHYTFTLRDVPVDAFWSVTIYNEHGYLEPNKFDSYSLNSVTATPKDDGKTFVLNLAPEKGDLHNYLFTPEGWNYVLRLYQPQAPILDGTWTFPAVEPMD